MHETIEYTLAHERRQLTNNIDSIIHKFEYHMNIFLQIVRLYHYLPSIGIVHPFCAKMKKLKVTLNSMQITFPIFAIYI